MLITILISGIIVVFLIEYFDDRKQKRRVIESARLAISQSNKELQQIDFNNDFASIENILLDRFTQININMKKQVLRAECSKKADAKVKILSYDDFCKQNLETENSRQVIQTEGFLLVKRKRTYYFYNLIKNFREDLFIITISTKKQPTMF